MGASGELLEGIDGIVLARSVELQNPLALLEQSAPADAACAQLKAELADAAPLADCSSSSWLAWNPSEIAHGIRGAEHSLTASRRVVESRGSWRIYAYTVRHHGAGRSAALPYHRT
jgi:hypothetical protein